MKKEWESRLIFLMIPILPLNELAWPRARHQPAGRAPAAQPPDQRGTGARGHRGRAAADGRGRAGGVVARPLPRRREPRPAPAAARDGPVRRGLARARARPRGRAARQQHQRIGRRARGPVLASCSTSPASTAAGSR